MHGNQLRSEKTHVLWAFKFLEEKLPLGSLTLRSCDSDEARMRDGGKKPHIYFIFTAARVITQKWFPLPWNPHAHCQTLEIE